jgi:hypothetical protein
MHLMIFSAGGFWRFVAGLKELILARCGTRVLIYDVWSVLGKRVSLWF